MKENKIITGLRKKWKLKIWLKIVLTTAILSVTAFLMMPAHLSIPVMTGITAGAFILSFFTFKSSFPATSDVLRLLDRQIPELEHSSDLLVKNDVQGLAAVQRKIAIKKLAAHYRTPDFPVTFRPLLWLAAAGMALILVRHFSTSGPDRDEGLINTVPAQQTTEAGKTDTVILDLDVSIVPPDYSGRKTIHQTTLDAENVLKGSQIYWKAELNPEPEHIWLKFSNGDSLHFNKQDHYFLTQKKVSDKGFYTLNYIDQTGKTIASDYARLEVVPDNPPEVAIKGIPQYQAFHPSEKAELSFDVHLADDYGLTDGYIIATITKGSGESVKFREQKIPFHKNVQGKDFNTTMSLSASQFEMETGNELYFYVEGVDNRQPSPQTTKTETYFFVLEDTSEVIFSLEGDLGLDLMPEYFRSQRQIIIDSEKLLAEQKSISRDEFNHRSNELGFDQKALRLKYGQFIGEESTSGLDIENEPQEEHRHQDPGQVDVLSEYGHDHDHENEEGQHMDKGTVNPKEDAVSEMSHSHDDAEQATFFEQSVKAKLKAALAQMWDAELYLNLYQPESSLPYQYRALNLLQDIKNQARIYVQRIGFDPPPVNEEKNRLTGDLEDVHGEAYSTQQKDEVIFPEIKKAVKALDGLAGKELPVKNNIKNSLNEAGNEVAGLAIEEPGKYLSLLSEIKSLSELDSLTADEVRSLRRNLLRVLPPPAKKPSPQKYPEHVLVEEFINKITERQP